MLRKTSVRVPAYLILFPLLALTVACGSADKTAEPEASSADVEASRQALQELLDEHWEYNMRTNPEWASIMGDKRWNDQSSDLSLQRIHDDLQMQQDFLERFSAIDTTGFPVQEALNQRLMVRDLEENLDNAKFENWLMPVNQMSGIHLMAGQFPAMLSFDSAQDFADYNKRMRALPKMLDDTLDLMRSGMEKGLMPPAFLLEKVGVQASGMAAQNAAESPFAQPLGRFPEDLSEEDRERITSELLATIEEAITPAYERFAAFVADEYAPAGRTEFGMWSLPDGEARYAARVASTTTTTMDPEEIHQLGLSEVARIEGEMAAIGRDLGFEDFGEFKEHISGNKELLAKSPDQIVEIYTKHIDRMYERLPELFGRLPQAGVEVLKMEDFRAKDDAAADYTPPAIDGSRPGRVNVNTYDAEGRSTVTMESTAYHEGVPGHHMQIAIAQELPELPDFRKQGGHTAYIEGWALYSERLGREVGFFEDPYSLYGHLQDEMLRAIRLVVDTGLHYKQWSRQDVVDFFHEHSTIDEIAVQNETDRYIVWPGQALGYKIGQLKILELRARAQEQLGESFDIRGFHDEILGAGSLPLDVLAERIDAWVAAQAAAG